MLVARDGANSTSIASNPTVVNLTIILLVLVLLASVLACGLYLIRRSRRRLRKEAEYCECEEKPTKGFGYHPLNSMSASSAGRSKSLHVYEEKRILVENSSSPPSSPDSVPEIRITFPEEEDGSGHRKSGRVVVVRVGETGVGLEPLAEDSAPSSRTDDAERFHSIDLERIGGLKER